MNLKFYWNFKKIFRFKTCICECLFAEKKEEETLRPKLSKKELKKLKKQVIGTFVFFISHVSKFQQTFPIFLTDLNITKLLLEVIFIFKVRFDIGPKTYT